MAIRFDEKTMVAAVLAGPPFAQSAGVPCPDCEKPDTLEIEWRIDDEKSAGEPFGGKVYLLWAKCPCSFAAPVSGAPPYHLATVAG